MYKRYLSVACALIITACSSNEEQLNYWAEGAEASGLRIEINNVISDKSNTAIEYTIFSNGDVTESLLVKFWANKFSPVILPEDLDTYDCTFQIKKLSQGENRFIDVCKASIVEGDAYAMVDDGNNRNAVSTVFHWSGGLDRFFYLYFQASQAVKIEVFNQTASLPIISKDKNTEQTIILTYLHITNDPLFIKIGSLDLQFDYKLQYVVNPEQIDFDTVQRFDTLLEGESVLTPGQEFRGEVSAGQVDWIKVTGF